MGERMCKMFLHATAVDARHLAMKGDKCDKNEIFRVPQNRK